MSREKRILAWHFVNEHRTLGHDAEGLAVEPGRIYSIEPHRTPKLCKYGMHASIHPLDALEYADGKPVVCRVRVWGDVQHGDDKIVGRHREVLWMADATRTMHEFAIWCVRELPVGENRTIWDLLTDPRSRKAIEVKEAWLRGEATDVELATAGDAAWDASSDASRDATWAAARAARAATWATGDAAGDATWAAAWEAAWATAGDTSRDATWAAVNARLENMLLALEGRR